MRRQCFLTGVAASIVVLALLLTACGGDDHGVVAETTGSAGSPGVAEADTDGPSDSVRTSETWTTAASDAVASDPRPCGTTTARDGAVVRIAVVAGTLSCGYATRLVETYYRDVPAPSEEDPAQRLVIEGWECVTDSAPEPGPVTTCTLSAGRGVVTAGP